MEATLGADHKPVFAHTGSWEGTQGGCERDGMNNVRCVTTPEWLTYVVYSTITVPESTGTGMLRNADVERNGAPSSDRRSRPPTTFGRNSAQPWAVNPLNGSTLRSRNF